ncbi:MAG: chromosome segregation protein SMC, partial [Candidatus Omnitrophica bacterium]|nr:chromosome segregation protein SMC [Candidatus Omnitrophota bacterium]
IEKALKEKEGLLIEITKMRTELSTVLEQEKNFLANLKMQSDFLNSQKELLNEKQKNFTEATLRQEELQNAINTLQAAIVNAKKEKEKIVVEFQDVKNKKSEFESLINYTAKEFKNSEMELNSLKDKLHNLQMALQENSFRIDTLKNRIDQTYNVVLEQLNVIIEEDADWTTINNEINELRGKIEKMGPVNLVAIEEHQELMERYDFLIKQQEDLANAKKSLLEAIRKINTTTRELFVDTFQKVRDEFKNYFRFLFGGGHAELVLMDEQDILECGIEIMARPPGKKLQSISLLSGGEKALCAIALLFSIFKVKPSPFCILDEVDAPLDESNIGKFAKLLSEFTKFSQFIIITHNKKTISMADVMYGITMEQSGVSKVVSVKFAKEVQEANVAS